MIHEFASDMPVPYTAATAMATAWRQAIDLLRAGQSQIAQAEKLLAEAFMPKYSGLTFCHAIRDSHRADPLNTAEVADVWKAAAWESLFERMEVRKVCSVKRAGELDQMLRSGKDLPDITEQAVRDIIRSTFEQMPDMLRELVHEVYDWLRPRRHEYKTNDRYAVGRKVVCQHMIDSSWGAQMPRPYYGSQEAVVRGLDNVMLLLDGKGVIQTYQGPLMEAIGKTPFGQLGETDYFKFRSYRNGNLHLEFKRADLLAKFNQIAGAGFVAPENEGSEA